jgi:hypothetical protein
VIGIEVLASYSESIVCRKAISPISEMCDEDVIFPAPTVTSMAGDAHVLLCGSKQVGASSLKSPYYKESGRQKEE